MEFNAYEFDQIARNVFYPIYPVIADQILQQAQHTNQGSCLDVGCGSGYLGLAIAEKTDMTIYLYDLSKDALDIANKNLEHLDMHNRVQTCYGDVEAIEYPDASFELVVSRGSLFFWQNQIKAINEIFRVLKPGGWAYIGGGFGNQGLKEEIDQKMLEVDKAWIEKAEKRKGSVINYEEIMKETQVMDFKVKEDESGLWIVFQKTESRDGI